MFSLLDITPSSSSVNDEEPNNASQPNLKPIKSQRYVDSEDRECDLKVPVTMQDFVYKKLSKKIENSIKFVDVKYEEGKTKRHADTNACVKLLRDFDPIIHTDLTEECCGIEHGKRKKMEIKRRIVEPDNCDEHEKLSLASISGEQVLQKDDTKAWKSRKSKSNKIFNYQEKNSTLYLIEPNSEFAALRKKNNWSENKIANFRRKNTK